MRLRPKMCLLLTCATLFAINPSLRSQSPPPDGKHTLVTPLPLVEGFQEAQIAIANRNPSAVAAKLHFRDEAGAEVGSAPVSLVPHDLQTISFSDVLKGLPLHSVRSVSLQYEGQFLALASQVTLLKYKDGASVDATLYEDREFASSQLNAVWWQPSDGRAFASITNTSDSPVTVSLTLDHDAASSILLQPHGTHMAEMPSLPAGSDLRSLGVRSSAPAGTIRATGFVASRDGSYVNTLRFLDPGLSLSDSLYATGLVLSGKSYVLAVQNITDQAITMTGRAFLSSDNDKASPPRSLAPEIVPPGEIVSLRLEKSVGASLKDIVALALTSSGGRGSFAASLTILYPNTPILSASVPFRDVSTQEEATGGYPWRIDGDYTTHAYITNTTDKERAVIVTLLLPSQEPYVVGRRVLAAGETQVYDVRHLRDAKIPDALGHTLPPDATYGQFIWGVDVSKVMAGGLLGRTVMESEADHALRSYSCPNCNCGYSVSYLSINPNVISLNLGSKVSASGIANYWSPCGTTLVPAPALVYPVWSSLNSSIASVDGAGGVVGVSLGSTTIDAQYYANYVTISGGSCTSYGKEFYGQATANVSQVPYADRIVSTTYNSAVPMCPNGAAGQPGWRRDVVKIVTDENGKDIAVSGQSLAETITIGSPNALLPPGTKPIIGTVTTNSSGQYTDSLYACSSTCPANTGQTNATQTITDKYGSSSYTLQSNQFVYKCSGITINGQ